MKLNLGCGHQKLAGYVNLDKYDALAPDMVCDLERFPWPFEDNAAEEIVMHHVLEHLGAASDAFLGIMKELYRICAPGAKIRIAVPHPRSDAFLGDPTHVRPISPAMLALFSKKNNREWQIKNCANTPLALYLDIDFEMSEVNFALSPHWAQKYQSGAMSAEEINFAISTYNNVVDEISLTLTAVK